MLDQLVKLVEQNAGDTIIRNTAIPDQFNNAAIQEVASSIFNTLQGQVAQGNMQQVISMFQSGMSQNAMASNPMITQMISNVATTFASKFGISSSQAYSIVSNLLPTVMNQFVQRTNNPLDNSFELSSMMKTMSGNSNLDVTSIVNQLASGNSQSGSLGILRSLVGKLFGNR